MGLLLGFLELAAISVWIGGIVFFSLAVAPSLFRTLGPHTAGRALRQIFPRYYLIGIACGVILMAVTAARGWLWHWNRLTSILLGVLAFMTGINLLARQAIVPMLDAAREAGRKRQFARLHRLSLLLNTMVLLMALVYLYWMAARGY